MKQREYIDGYVGFVQSVDLRETPGGMDLISVRETDQLWSPGRSARVKKCTHGRPIYTRIKVEPIRLTRNRLVEAAKPVAKASILADNQDLLQGLDALDYIIGFLPYFSDGTTRTDAPCARKRSAIASSLRR